MKRHRDLDKHGWTSPAKRVSMVLSLTIMVSALGLYAKYFTRDKWPERYDRAVFDAIVKQSTGDSIQGASLVSESRIPPCEGDSGQGPLVSRTYEATDNASEALTDYVKKYELAGWRRVEVFHQLSVGGNYIRTKLSLSLKSPAATIYLETQLPDGHTTQFTVIFYGHAHQECGFFERVF